MVETGGDIHGRVDSIKLSVNFNCINAPSVVVLFVLPLVEILSNIVEKRAGKQLLSRFWADSYPGLSLFDAFCMFHINSKNEQDIVELVD